MAADLTAPRPGDPEFETLILAYLDGDLTDDEAELAEHLLETYPEAAALYDETADQADALSELFDRAADEMTAAMPDPLARALKTGAAPLAGGLVFARAKPASTAPAEPSQTKPAAAKRPLAPEVRPAPSDQSAGAPPVTAPLATPSPSSPPSGTSTTGAPQLGAARRDDALAVPPAPSSAGPAPAAPGLRARTRRVPTWMRLIPYGLTAAVALAAGIWIAPLLAPPPASGPAPTVTTAAPLPRHRFCARKPACPVGG